MLPKCRHVVVHLIGNRACDNASATTAADNSQPPQLQQTYRHKLLHCTAACQNNVRMPHVRSLSNRTLSYEQANEPSSSLSTASHLIIRQARDDAVSNHREWFAGHLHTMRRRVCQSSFQHSVYFPVVLAVHVSSLTCILYLPLPPHLGLKALLIQHCFIL
jgi:hypothetical protein